MASPLDDWKFLVGEWKGETKDQFDEKEVVRETAIYLLEPSERFITGRQEAWSDKGLVNKSISLMFFDGAQKKFKRKTFFSYGFVNNEVEYVRNEKEIRFDVTMEPLSKNFEGTRWRSYIRKISEDKIATGLEEAKEGGEFKSYGETVMVKAKH
jgi:hypothetical protein